MLCAEFKSILNPIDVQYREKMNKMKTERKGNKPYTEKIKSPLPSGWFIQRTFAYGDVPDSLKINRGKNSVERFKRRRGKALVWNFPLQPMTGFTDVLKKEYEPVEKCHICLKEFHNPENRQIKDYCHYLV